MVNALHINDNNLVVTAGTKSAAVRGYAWLKGDDVVFDTGATSDSPVQNCRIAPQEINTRYWQHCDQNAVAPNGAGMRHSADLIWRHLGELKQQHQLQRLSLIVPSHYRESNLQLLLGVAQSSGLEIAGLVNKAVLALHPLIKREGDYRHIDVQLHQTVVSSVHASSRRIRLGDVEVLQDTGVVAMQEALLKGLQENFIRNDRFDPLHDAATEQQLFDQLADIAQQISETGKANIGLQHQGRIHSSSIDAKEWDTLLAPFVERIMQTTEGVDLTHVLLDLNAAFDGVIPAGFRAAKVVIVEGVPDLNETVAQTAHDGSLRYVTELPATSISSPAEAPRPRKPVTRKPVANGDATHLLFAGRAVPIDGAEVVSAANSLQVRPGSPNVLPLLASGKLFIMNDESRKELKLNDRLGSHLADGVITVIQVVQ